MRWRHPIESRLSEGQVNAWDFKGVRPDLPEAPDGGSVPMMIPSEHGSETVCDGEPGGSYFRDARGVRFYQSNEPKPTTLAWTLISSSTAPSR